MALLDTPTRYAGSNSTELPPTFLNDKTVSCGVARRIWTFYLPAVILYAIFLFIDIFVGEPKYCENKRTKLLPPLYKILKKKQQQQQKKDTDTFK